jgi:hypothetical protein
MSFAGDPGSAGRALAKKGLSGKQYSSDASFMIWTIEWSMGGKVPTAEGSGFRYRATGSPQPSTLATEHLRINSQIIVTPLLNCSVWFG